MFSTDLRLRVIEHNIYTISKYYSEISIPRLGQILELPQDEAEERVCAMVSERGLVAKIDRPARTIIFGAKPSTSNSLNAWSDKISGLLNLVEKTCQQIQKESQIHKVAI